jgi:hypothetical protein
MSTSSGENKRARVGLSKRSSFTDDLNSQTLLSAVTLLRNLDEVDFGNFLENQLQPIVDDMNMSIRDDEREKDPHTLLRECLHFLVLKKLAGDEDATKLSPTDGIDQVWHQLILNTRLYKSINDALGGEMIHHNPEGGRDVGSRNERVFRAIEMHQVVFRSSEWELPERLLLLPQQGEDPAMITFRVQEMSGRETLFKTSISTNIEMVKEAFCRHRGLEVPRIRFYHCGDQIVDGPIHDALKHDDRIDCYPEQNGC